MEGANDTWERWMESYTRAQDAPLYPQGIIDMMVVAATGKPQAAPTARLTERWKHVKFDMLWPKWVVNCLVSVVLLNMLLKRSEAVSMFKMEDLLFTMANCDCL